jgi:hypothetical protein
MGVVMDVVVDELEIPACENFNSHQFPYSDFNTHVPRRLGTKGEILLHPVPATRISFGPPTLFRRNYLLKLSTALVS